MLKVNGDFRLMKSKAEILDEYQELKNISMFRRLLPVLCVVLLLLISIFFRGINTYVYWAVLVVPVIFEGFMLLVNINKKLDLISELFIINCGDKE